MLLHQSQTISSNAYVLGKKNLASSREIIKKSYPSQTLSLLTQKMGVLAESFSLKTEKFSFSFKLQKLLENGIVLLRHEQKFSF